MGSSCCASGEATSSQALKVTPTNTGQAKAEDCDAPLHGCEDDCCGHDATNPAPVHAALLLAGSSCGKTSGSVVDGEQPLNHGCCDAPQTAPTDDTHCCSGKTSPCCDDKCLDRLALRECHGQASHASSCDTPDTPASTVSTAKACGRHRRSARERYGPTLEALGCICRALIARGLESCCETKKPSRTDRKRHSTRRAAASMRRRASDDSYATGSSKAPRASVCARGQADKCCGDEACQSPSEVQTQMNQAQALTTCCADGRIGSGKALCDAASKANPSKRHGDPCCSSGETSSVNKARFATHDPENQASGTEHIVLCVSGMTCTGCETKLNRTLATVAGVKNLKTSLVLSRAEFDIDLGSTTAESVIKHLERTTEFTCEQVSNYGTAIDLVVDGDGAALVNRTWPAGVRDVSVTGKNMVRIAFDPHLVGARNLLDQDWGAPIRLAPMRGDPGLEAGSKHIRHVGYTTLLSIALTIPVLVLAWAPLPERPLAYSCASLSLATIVQVAIAGPFYPRAIKALIFSRVIEMDLLIVLSTSAAYVFSVVSFGYLIAGRPLSTGQFFETSTLLVTLIMVGRYISALARQRAVMTISMRSLQASTALICDESNGEREIDARLLQYGDTFKVLPESRIPTDGTVLSGSSEVDESMLTGESLLVEKLAKSSVIAGTVNGSGTLVVRLTRLPSDNTITAVSSMVDEAKLSKPQLQELADRVASYFVPVVIALTAITFVIWIAVGLTVQRKSGSEATVQAITYAITVLIVSCPCAIGLAVPMVVVIASGLAAERGVVFKSAGVIEAAHRTSHVVFDKTGTLTEGKLKVVSENILSRESICLSLLLGLIKHSRHPVSVAVAEYLILKTIEPAAVPDGKSLAGKGMEAQTDERTLRAGNSSWLNLSSDAAVQSVLARNLTAFCFTVDGGLVAVYGLENSIRDNANTVVSDLQARGILVHIVSGDDEGAVQAVATKLQIPSSNTRARSSPADKQSYIQTLLRASDHDKEPVVVFCGDGTNDAVALAQSTIGVHISEGSDVAKSAADVVLLRPDLAGIAIMVDTSRRSVNRIRFNFAWSFVYNIFAVLLASGAFVKARIPPQFAGLGELISVLPVILAAVLLRLPERRAV